MLVAPALDAVLAEWGMVALNVLGTLYAMHAALPHLVRAAEDSPRRVADLVTIDSTAGECRTLAPGQPPDAEAPGERRASANRRQCWVDIDMMG
jgi:NAD(P)-dependent dehydrogenase (short-subunit alcohol dehydrogenase family)